MQALDSACKRLRWSLAAQRFWVAAGHLERALKYNPNWHLQPRVPAGQDDGGQWLPGGPSAVLPALVRLGPVVIAGFRAVARRVRPFLTRRPKNWTSDMDFPADDQFDRETGRVGPVSSQRPGHPALRFRSERELRDYIGPAGPGREWHHIVEKRLADNGRFPPELIHSTDNIISLPIEVHRRISAIMSMKDRRNGGMVHRKWVEQSSFGEQYNMGLDLIDEVSKGLGYEFPN